MEMRLSITDLGLRDMLNALRADEQIVRPAAARAINRGLQSIRRPIARAVANELRIRPQKLIGRRIKIDRARPSSLVGYIRVLQRPVPVILLSGARQTRSGVTAGGTQYPHAFIARGQNSGKRHVFRRRGRARLPIDAQRIQIADQVDREVAKHMPKAQEKMQTVLEHELKFRLRQKGYLA
jgi:hypothetical protein